MTLFNDSIEALLLLPPASAAHHRHLGATTAVLKYAPRRLRLENGDEAIARAQADARYWRERAFKAETTLRALETRVQQLARRAQGR
ncbi:hypothetical protein [Undibacter mobilis]|uniref:hypothetical protein n=1 Tax=Undibacter mobilis TaxID=2292256 RepID=UPI0011C06170|nr:hypothetical protein [Undibacter mobilis]